MIRDLCLHIGKFLFVFETKFTSCDCEVDRNNGFRVYTSNVKICGFDYDVSDKTHKIIYADHVEQLKDFCTKNNWVLWNP